MKNLASKKLIITWLSILCFAIAFLVGKFIFLAINERPKEPQLVSVSDGGTDVEYTAIGSAIELELFIKNYEINSAQYSNANVIITADIDMSGIVVDGTIGTANHAFEGTFDGQGYRISNLSIDLSESNSTTKYVGLFGKTDLARIENLYLSGTTTFKIGSCDVAYVGGVVGYAEGTICKNIQNVAEISVSDDLLASKELYFGGFAGRALNCQKFENIISRTNKITNNSENSSLASTTLSFSVANNQSAFYNIGGFIGSADNMALKFGVFLFKVNFDFSTDFKGNVNIGGIVGNVVQNTSSIRNCVCENNISIDTTNLNSAANLYAGEVAGTVSNPTPKSGNLCYIYYKTNSTRGAFGRIGDYTYSDSSSRDNISAITVMFSDQEAYNTHEWNSIDGNWNFSSVWYFNFGVINLQCCKGDFLINLGTNLSSNVVIKNMQNDYNDKYRYGKSAQIVFSFVEVEEDDEIVNMQSFYNLSSVTRNGETLEDIILVDGEYKLAGEGTLYSLEKGSGDSYIFTINNINMSNSGEYDITYVEKRFDVTITSKLFDKNGDLETIYPAEVYQTSGQRRDVLPISMSYDISYTINKILKNPNSPYVFDGWYVVGDSTDVKIAETDTLSIIFGHGIYSGEMTIYARFDDDACVVTFKMDEGIRQIDVSRSDDPITRTNTSIAIPKTDTSFILEIYIKDGYSFDVEDFMKSLDIYKSSDTTSPFCRWENENEQNEKYFIFSLDLTTLKGDYADSLNVDVQSTKITVSNSNMVWYIVGGAGGVLALAGIIVLIVILKRRGGGFGGGSSGGFNKKSYKNMYY